MITTTTSAAAITSRKVLAENWLKQLKPAQEGSSSQETTQNGSKPPK